MNSIVGVCLEFIDYKPRKIYKMRTKWPVKWLSNTVITRVELSYVHQLLVREHALLIVDTNLFQIRYFGRQLQKNSEQKSFLVACVVCLSFSVINCYIK